MGVPERLLLVLPGELDVENGDEKMMAAGDCDVDDEDANLKTVAFDEPTIDG